jgi:mono/diheme cytochrome c family protein
LRIRDKVRTGSWMAMLGLSALLLMVSAGQARPGAASPEPGPEKDFSENQMAKAPEKWKARANPLEHDPEAVATGKKLFGMHCSECHGQTGEGTRRAPTMRSADVQEATPGAIFWVLTNGVVWHGMPVWSKLPEPQRWQLVSYIKSLGLKSKDLQ